MAKKKKQSVFDALAAGARIRGYIPRTVEAQNYYRRRAMKLKTLTPRQMMRENTSMKVPSIPNSKEVIGHMVMFEYDAKHKKTLPHWDRHPLIFILKPLPDGFLGLNFHYLPYKWRAILLNQLSLIVNNRYFDERTRVKMTYNLLNSTQKYLAFRPCLKRYLSKQVKSQFLWIPASDWEIAIFLPLQKFEKESNQAIWNKSIRTIYKR